MQTAKTKLLVFLAVWKRPYITEICFTGIKRMKTHPDYEINALAVISEPEMIPLCEKYGIDWVMHDNNPLGAKKNFGLQKAKEFDFDFLMEIGSDDLILNELLTHYLPYLKFGFIGVKDVAYLDSSYGECRRHISKSTYGAGRVISRSILEKMGWKLWKEELNKGLDNNSVLNLALIGFNYTQVHPLEFPCILDIKSEVNIWHFNYFVGKPYDKKEILNRISKEENEMIDELCCSLKQE